MATDNRRTKRGFTLIEGIVATVILAVAIVAMFGSWGACFAGSQQIAETTSAANVCQNVLETAMTYGANNIPTGTYNSSSQTGSWSGAYIPATGWTSGATAYYNFKGVQLTSSTGAFFSLTVSITDSSVLPGAGTTYTLTQQSLRSVVVTITNISSGAQDFQMATNLVQGGV